MGKGCQGPIQGKGVKGVFRGWDVRGVVRGRGVRGVRVVVRERGVRGVARQRDVRGVVPKFGLKIKLLSNVDKQVHVTEIRCLGEFQRKHYQRTYGHTNGRMDG